MRNLLSIKFFLYPKSKQGNELQIYCRLIINRKKVEFATGYFIHIDKWDKHAERHVNKNHNLNGKLDEIKGKVGDIKHQLTFEKKPVSARIVKKIYFKEDDIGTFLIKYFDQYLLKNKLGRKKKDSSIELFQQTRDKLSIFIKTSWKEPDISIREVDYKFISEFDVFLNKLKAKNKNEPLGKLTIYKHHSRFSTVLNEAKREGHIKEKPYENYTLKKPKSNRLPLTKEELSLLIDNNFANNLSLQKARDIFIFAVYTGLRLGDLKALTVEKIKQHNGIYYIEIEEQGKTEKPVAVPLLNPALEVFHKYNNEERKITGKVLPKFSGRINTTLKYIASLVEIKKNICMHVARHTFITTVLMANNVNLKIASAWAGHTNVSQTEKYAHVDFSHLAEIAHTLNRSL